MLFYVLFILYCSMYCLCVNVYCHRVTTQLQLTNISYHIISYHIINSASCLFFLYGYFVKFSNNIPICDVLLHASLTGTKICFMMIGSVVINREHVCCSSSIHELSRPSIFSLPPVWLSTTPTQWMLMSLPGSKAGWA